MKKIILIFFLILNISCKNVTISEKVDKNHLVSDREIYNFLDFILENEPTTITKCKNFNVSDLFIANPDLKKIFTDKDLIFINKQIKNENYFNLNSEYLINKNVIPQNELRRFLSESNDAEIFWRKLKNKYNAESYSSVSLPIFSKNKKIAIISTEFSCKGGLCGEGAIRVFIKVDGNWKFYDKLQIWVS